MVNVVPGFKRAHRLRNLAVEHVEAVPEEEVGHAHEEDQARCFRSGGPPANGRPPQPFEPFTLISTNRQVAAAT